MTNTPELLRTVTSDAPLLSSPLESKQLATMMLAWAGTGITVRTVRGAKMRTTQGLFDEVAAALQFPYYFGENWAAFDECLADLDWLPISSGLVIVVYSADQVLLDAEPAEFDTFVKVVKRASIELGRPVEDGEVWDRAAIPFHVVLQLHEGHPGRWRPAAEL